MWTAFVNLTQLFGMQLGYLFSFIIYWILWCFLFPLFSLKSFKALFSLFKSVKPRFGNKPDITLFLISWPVAVALIFAFVPRLHNLTISILIVSVLIGFVNGFAEEILWRGVYITLFPNNIWFKYIYPSVFFTLWHLCPISVVPSKYAGGIYSFLLAALLYGLSWGYYARKTGSIRWSSIMHSINDSLGLSGFLYSSWFL
jgi:membrane protease YdiL (CAAX protease family)